MFYKLNLPKLTMLPKMISKDDLHLNVQSVTWNFWIIWDTGKKIIYFLYTELLFWREMLKNVPYDLIIDIALKIQL